MTKKSNEEKGLIQLYVENWIIEMVDERAKESARTRTQYIKDLILKDIRIR